MKKKFILGLFILITLFAITGCGNSTEPGKQQGKDDNSTIVGYYEAYEAVQYGQKFDEKATNCIILFGSFPEQQKKPYF